ncbi:hypothetical protein FLP41_03070 (plasmid) [Paracoccus marcusii]|uniref:hypothetical protein n=1 Tax=Paracoccus marcusii TaxID=59779 RepID=UPI002ED01228|nr:hypothetical protein FLP41_03070 [Paracoccus marcusii]
MTPLDEEISFAETRPSLAQRPLMALALAMLAQALPEASNWHGWSVPGRSRSWPAVRRAWPQSWPACCRR